LNKFKLRLDHVDRHCVGWPHMLVHLLPPLLQWPHRTVCTIGPWPSRTGWCLQLAGAEPPPPSTSSTWCIELGPSPPPHLPWHPPLKCVRSPSCPPPSLHRHSHAPLIVKHLFPSLLCLLSDQGRRGVTTAPELKLPPPKPPLLSEPLLRAPWI
jgi:hypothetical protein